MKGKVYIVGAGPGDPELLTVKASRILQTADVVLSDRLVSPEILSHYTSSDAEIVYVGKQCRKGASTPQATINDLMVIYAAEGKKVVRLKGGDVSIFSNVLDELETLVKHRIAYEIVPGVTAALGAAAYGGIPLTARDFATAVRFLTAYKTDVVKEAYWKELAQTDDTLVFYMSSETLENVVNKLTKYSIDPAKQLAVIEQATTPFQQIHISDLYEFDRTLKDHRFASPTLVIIGKVVSLHQQFAWLQTNAKQADYFTSLYELPATTKQQLGLTA
jgi:uroporphyrin-III C-methyltransferase